MIKWITENIGTGAYNEIYQLDLNGIRLIDVRDLVDKSGNDAVYIKNKVDESVASLKKNEKVVICCDYGMSRSNSIATGVIAQWLNISFKEAITLVQNYVDPAGIKIEVLNTVYDALYAKDTAAPVDNSSLLITGGKGFIGKRLKEAFDPGHHVFAPGSNEINLLNENISLYNTVRLNNIRTIIHLANPRIFTTNKSVGDTLTMLKNVLDVCRTNRIRLIYLSGWEIYSGYKSQGLMANEGLPPNPKGPYGEAKWLCELLIKQYHLNYGLNYQIIRSGPVYGAGGEKPKFIYNFINKAMNNEDIVTHRYQNGFPLLDLMYVDDLINALKELVNSDFLGEINIGSGIGISTFEIATLICRLTGSKSRISHTNIQEHASNIIMDTANSRSFLKWKPETEIETGMKRILETIKKS